MNPDRVLEVRDLTVRFGGLRALDGVTLDVRPGEVVGIIGPNGAGKTTLFNAICGFVRPDSGTIRYGADRLDGIRPHRLPSLGVARTIQGLGLWQGLSLLENVMAGGASRANAGFWSSLLGLPRSDRAERDLRERALGVMADLRFAELGARLPGEVPYGVQKRASLARALMSEPSILLLDEPASGLPDEAMADLGSLIRDLRSRMSVAIVEHHMDLVMSVCDRVEVLELGRVIASGTTDEVKRDPAVMDAYLGEEVDRHFDAPDP
ncbi:MAG TPA: ABC transporter ATP-binding protein [Actinomycetota bacterium]|jgi:branched-chain amino acid transport system ATP-binding protein